MIICGCKIFSDGLETLRYVSIERQQGASMRKICKYDQNNWLMQDKDKNLLLFNEQTNQIFDLQSFIQPERSKREDLYEEILKDIEPMPVPNFPY
jgi:hypothetical protein